MKSFREYLAEAKSQNTDINKSDIGQVIRDNEVLLYVGNDGGYRVYDIGNETIETYNKQHKLIDEFIVYKKEFDIIQKYIK